MICKTNEVFSIDMEYGKCKICSRPADGMYIVKTFHLSDTPIQKFIIEAIKALLLISSYSIKLNYKASSHFTASCKYLSK